MARVELRQGDLTAQPDIDAIVNAANEQLAAGGGVCGAIRRVGGAAVFEEAARLGGCPTGDAKATGAGDLPNRFVIHAVGPVYSGTPRDAELLASCHRRAVEVAAGARLQLDRVPRDLDRDLRLSGGRGGAGGGRCGACGGRCLRPRPRPVRAVRRGRSRGLRRGYLTVNRQPIVFSGAYEVTAFPGLTWANTYQT